MTIETNTRTPRKMGWFEGTVVVFLLMMLSSAFIRLGWVDISLTLIQILAVIIGLFMIRNHLGRFIRVVFSDLPLLFIILWGLLSYTWSQDPAITFRQGIWLLLSSIFAMMLVTRYNLKQIMQLVIISSGVFVIVSYVFVLLLPEYGIMVHTYHNGLWRGVFNHKNDLVRYAASAGVLAVYFGGILRWWRWPVFVISIILLTYSDGVAGNITFLAFLALVPLLRLLRLRASYVTAIVLIAVPLILVVIGVINANTAEILTFFGRDATLTGRTDLWDASLEVISMEPIFGYGLAASFADGSIIHNFISWDAPFAHNHWLDMSLDLGMLVTAAFTFSLVRAIARAINMIRRTEDKESMSMLVYLALIIALTFSNASLMILVDIMWIAFIALVCGLAVYQEYDEPIGETSRRPRWVRSIQPARQEAPAHA